MASRRHVEFWTGHPEKFNAIIEALPYFLLSIQSWVYKVIDGGSLVTAIRGGSPPTWSISTEWFFYFAYPALAWLVLRARSVPAIVLVALIWCALWTAFSSGLYQRTMQLDAWAVARFGTVAGIQNHDDSFVRWLMYESPYLRIGEFVLGVIVAQLYVALLRRNVTAAESVLGRAVFFVAAASVALITYWEYSPDVPMNVFREMNMNFALAPSVALLVFCAARYRNSASLLLTSRPAIALGNASYSIYLVHSVVLISAVKLTAGSVHGVPYNIAKLVVLMAIVIATSLVLYTFYEAPARQWLRQWWRQRPAFAAQSSPT